MSKNIIFRAQVWREDPGTSLESRHDKRSNDLGFSCISCLEWILYLCEASECLSSHIFTTVCWISLRMKLVSLKPGQRAREKDLVSFLSWKVKSLPETGEPLKPYKIGFASSGSTWAPLTSGTQLNESLLDVSRANEWQIVLNLGGWEV